MPGGDRTGPMGMGPMTGRRAGYCTGSSVPGFMSRVVGRGFWGGGRGRRRGWRNWFYATGLPGWRRAAWGWPAFAFAPRAGAVGAPAAGAPAAAPPIMTREQELEMLRQQAQGLASALDEIKKRIDELAPQDQPK